jgi:TRAP-type mannitol/chloroaromatic compound transport system permease small subunit
MVNKITLTLDNISEWVCNIFKWLGAIIMLLIVYEVVSRYAFNRPHIWGMDMQLQFSAIHRMVGIGYCLLRRGHVKVDILTVRLTSTKRMLMEVYGYLFFFFPTIAAITISMTIETVKSWQVLERSFSPWRYPVYPMKTMLVACYFLLLMAGFSELIKDMKTLKLGSEAWLKDR